MTEERILLDIPPLKSLDTDDDPVYFSWKHYRRTPIQIHDSCCILIQLFTGHEDMRDLWTTDVEPTEPYEALYERAAEQFIAQLEGHDCIAFHQALIRACQRRVDAWAAGAKELDGRPL